MAAPDTPIRSTQLALGQRRSVGFGNHDVEKRSKVVDSQVVSRTKFASQVVGLGGERLHVSDDQRLDDAALGSRLTLQSNPLID